MHHPTGRACRVALTISAFSLSLSTSAQRPPAQPDAAGILHGMRKLQVLGSVLYIAAHPDDENTRLIAWLANGKKVRTGYLSLTRGEGGQNLIGPELGDALGIIRTQELLEARRIDGGEQFFTRAVDFGYSKSAEESFEKWGRQEVLSDVVRVIRLFRPDVIITRFSTEPGGHGHHTASAILAHEAFDLAGDPKAFPEQLEQGLEVWQPRRLFFNASTWWRKDLPELVKNDASGEWSSVDVGGYDPLLGLSYTEIAGRSRSMHKSQGFGAAETRGEMMEYLHLEKGDKPKSKDIFEGIDMTHGRTEHHGSLDAVARSLVSGFDPLHPEKSMDELQRFSDSLNGPWIGPADRSWVTRVGNEVDRLWADCAGLSLQLNAADPYVAIGDSCWIETIAVSRNKDGLMVDRMDDKFGTPDPGPLEINTPSVAKGGMLSKAVVDEPFWLKEPHGALYSIPSTSLIGTAVAPQTMRERFSIPCLDRATRRVKAPGCLHHADVPVTYKWVDRVDGERIRPVYVTPVASVVPEHDVLIARGGPQEVVVEVEALTDSLTGRLNVTLPEGWSTTKDLKLVNIPKRNVRQSFTYQLIPGENAKAGAVRFEFSGPKGKADRTLHQIDHPHIMPQVYYTPAEVKLVPLDVKTTARTVGYIMGAGDEVSEAIEQLGVKVETIDPGRATLESLRKYDAIVIGIRAYNTTEELKDLHPVLMKYVEEGGTLVVQYNTQSRDMVLPDSLIGPYPFKLTRDRVTVEEATPTFLAKDHPLLNTPNKITAADFEGWVQERGLYFCGSLDARYTPLIAWNDPGEQPLNGALITCDYGKGRYVYTGISFFRQLPAGVPGAYRLFANLVSRRANGPNQ